MVIIQKSGSWFSYNGDKLAQGRDAVKALLKDNPDLMEELEKRITEKLGQNANALETAMGQEDDLPTID